MMTVISRFTVLSATAVFLHAQGTPPRAALSDYSAHATLDKGFSIGADYLVRSLPTPAGTLVADDYLVVEAMFFGPVQSLIKMSAGHFMLRINGQKVPLLPDSHGMVAGSIKYPDWTEKPTVIGTVGNGNGDVIFGAPPAVARFPGDPSVRPPIQNPAPDPNPTGLEKEPVMSIDERVERSAMPETTRVAPAGGLLFFPYRGKTKSIKSVELIYEGPAGKATLKLL